MKFELVVLVFSINFLLVLVFFIYDRSDNVKNCFLISKQPFRIFFVLLLELVMVGLVLPIEDFGTAVLW